MGYRIVYRTVIKNNDLTHNQQSELSSIAVCFSADMAGCVNNIHTEKLLMRNNKTIEGMSMPAEINNLQNDKRF